MMEGLGSKQNEDFFKSKNAKKESSVINGATVDSVDVTPDKLKTEVPILVVPGWGATMESFKPGLKVLADAGRRAISLDQPRKGGVVPLMHNTNVEAWYKERGQEYPKWPDEEIRKAGTILGLIEQKKLDKVDVIAHSEGAINTLVAAMFQPEKFDSIVLYAPAGLIGKDSIFRLQKGAGATKSRTETVSHLPVNEAETEYLESTKNITPEYIKANPLRAVKEILAISQAQIEDMLRYVQSRGIKVAIMTAVDDTMFPQERMQKNVKSTGVPDGFVDGYLSVRGGHMQIQVHPELYMSAAESLLTSLNKKKNKEINS